MFLLFDNFLKFSFYIIFEFPQQLATLRDRVEEESEKKTDGLKALSKMQSEIQLWRSKFETEGVAKVEEFEGAKTTLIARVSEAEDNIVSLNL